jgi:unsaturated rhamnogalacturonyl hydrolase
MRRSLSVISILFFSVISCYAQLQLSPEKLAVKEKLLLVANSIVKETTFKFIDKQTGKTYSSAQEAPADAVLSIESPYNDWRYWNGVLNNSFIYLSDILADSTYRNYVKKNIELSFDNYNYFKTKYKNEGKWNYPFGQYFMMEELDDCGAMGANVIELYRSDKQKRYKDYIDQAASHITKKQARLKDETLVRTFPHKWTLWADDLYMGLSFLTRMGELTGDKKYFDDAAAQVINFHKYLFDANKGLMYHCYYSDINRQGVAFWGRANGWAMLAQVELLDRLPLNHPERKILIELLQQHIIGVSRYQSGDGLWHQLLDKTDSYLETSCTAMFTYSIARAINKGYIEPRYDSIAKRGWEGLATKIQPDGKVEGICAGTGTSDDLIHYYHRPTPVNDIHGLGAIIYAGIEILKMKD